MANGHGGPRVNSGRRHGSKNVLGSVRESFERVFHALQDDDEASLENWAKRNPGEFYKLASKLLPMQVTADGSLSLVVATGIPGITDGDDLV